MQFLIFWLLAEKNGPAILAGPPFNVDFNMLERDLGLTIDDSVFEFNFSSADFHVLGENVGSLVRRGLAPVHVQHMQEPASNFQLSLDACPADIQYLFPQIEEATEQQVEAPKPNRARRAAGSETTTPLSQRKRSYITNCRRNGKSKPTNTIKGSGPGSLIVLAYKH